MRAIVLAACALGLGTNMAMAQDAKKPELTKLPWNPYAQAKEGDWNKIATTQQSSMFGTLELSWTRRVSRVSDDAVTIVRSGGMDATTTEYTYSKKGDLTLEGLIGKLDEGETVSGVTIKDEKKSVGGREFACTKVSYVVTAAGSSVDQRIWLSKDVTPEGVVAREEGPEGGKLSFESELVSFGSGDRVAWEKKAKEKDPAPKLPFNPFAQAKEGDWETVVETVHSSRFPDPIVSAMTYRVSKVADDVVTIVTTKRDGFSFDTPYSRKAELTLEAFTSFDKVTFSDVTIQDEKKTVGGREFACTRLSFVVPGGLRGATKRRLWLSKAVKSKGVVAVEVESDGGEADRTEIVGFGSGDKVEWGKKAEEVDLEAFKHGAPEPKEEAKLPFNPYENAKVGDWQVVAMTVDGGGAHARSVMTFRTTAVSEGGVTLAVEYREKGEPTTKAEWKRSRKETQTVAEFIGSPPGEISGFEVGDEKKTVGGKEFACKRLSWTRRTTFTDERSRIVVKRVGRWTLWLSREARGDGVVAKAIDMTDSPDGQPDQKGTLGLEVLGFGSGDKVEWGKRPEDVNLDDAK